MRVIITVAALTLGSTLGAAAQGPPPVRDDDEPHHELVEMEPFGRVYQAPFLVRAAPADSLPPPPPLRRGRRINTLALIVAPIIGTAAGGTAGALIASAGCSSGFLDFSCLDRGVTGFKWGAAVGFLFGLAVGLGRGDTIERPFPRLANVAPRPDGGFDLGLSVRF